MSQWALQIQTATDLDPQEKKLQQKHREKKKTWHMRPKKLRNLEKSNSKTESPQVPCAAGAAIGAKMAITKTEASCNN